MKKLEYLSPTAIAQFFRNPEEFYLVRLAEPRVPREPQTAPMAVGSAFDAYAKSCLHRRLVGDDPKYSFETLFETQVEPQCRDEARVAGKLCFDRYEEIGALAALEFELRQAQDKPCFEFEIKGEVDGVPLLGRPDLFFVNAQGCPVVFDWKVNGYYSKFGVSPMRGYVLCRPNGGAYPGVVAQTFKGMAINVGCCLSQLNEDWARQLSVYAYLTGSTPEFIAAVDQVACRPGNIRIAEHRLRITEEYQRRVITEAKHVWEVVNSDHVFRSMSLADSQARCAVLDRMAAKLAAPQRVR
jgi:hypothetical protein